MDIHLYTSHPNPMMELLINSPKNTMNSDPIPHGKLRVRH